MNGSVDEAPRGASSNRLGGIPERYVPGEGEGEMIEAEHLARYRWASGLAAGRRVLDAGCGSGYGARLIAEAGAASVSGVDSDPEAVAEAQRAGGSGVEVVAADLTGLPFEDESFDLVVCFEVIEHLEDHEAALDELARVLAGEGLIAISSPNPGGYPAGNPHHVHELSPEELRSALERRFGPVRLFAQRTWHATSILEQPAGGDQAGGEVGDPSVSLISAAGAEQPYTIAIAGRGELPAPSPLVALTGGIDQRELASSWHEQRMALETQGARLRELERLNAERAEQMTAAEQLLAQLPALWAARAELEAIQRSPGRRLAAAPRTLGRRLRKRLAGARMALKRAVAAVITRLGGRERRPGGSGR